MGSRLRQVLLVGPGLAWLAVFLLAPCLIVLFYSFLLRGIYGGIDYIPTLENYVRAADPLYLRIFLKSAGIAAATTAIALLLGYPAAWAIARAPGRFQAALLVLAILPFWSNYLIRTYAWIVILNTEGLLNRALVGLGILHAPVSLLYSDGAIVTGLVYGYLPFMILALYASVSRVPAELLEASADLGAAWPRTLVSVLIPLTLPGIAAGSVFVFVLSIGNFITPDLLGGGKSIMVGNLIYDQFLSARDWPFGSALAFLLMAIMLLLLAAQGLLVARGQGRR